MRAHLLLSTAAVLWTAACASSVSIPRPTTAVAPAVVSGEAPGLTVWTPPSTAGSASAVSYFAVDREAYAAAFAVTREGRLRVVWPESPSSTGFVKPGRTYEASAWMSQYGGAGFGLSTRVPYTFVVVSDQRLDLSRFGAGSKWRYQLSVRGSTDEETTIEAIARSLLPSEEAAYAADYTYVAPRVVGQAAYLAQQCAVRTASSRDYSYFRDLWAVVDPSDPYLGPTAFAASWAYALGGWFPYAGRGAGLGLLLDRASRATAAFRPGCTRSLAYPLAYAYGIRYNPYNTLGQPTIVQSGPLPGTPPAVDSAAGSKPGDRLRVRPSEVFGAPGAMATGNASTGDAGAAERRRAERLARVEAMRERRRGGATGESQTSWAQEPLTDVDRGRRERELRVQDRMAAGRAAGDDAFGGRRNGEGRGGLADDGRRTGGRSADGATGGRSTGGRTERSGPIERGRAASEVDRGSTSRPERSTVGETRGSQTEREKTPPASPPSRN